MIEIARVGSRLRGASWPRIHVNASTVAVGAVAGASTVYFAACGVLVHLSFNSFGWDLGIFDQVMWSIVNGHGFHYSFRDMSYLGDHFQPVLVLLAPLVLLGLGPAPLLMVQGVALGAAVFPLHAAVRRLAAGPPLASLAADSPAPPLRKEEVPGDTPGSPAEGLRPSALPLWRSWAEKASSVGPSLAAQSMRSPRHEGREARGMTLARYADVAAWAISAAYLLSLGVARAVGYDFHPEAFVPLLAFTALWALTAKRTLVFAAATLALLPLKEDMGFLTLGLCWVAWFGFGEKKTATAVALLAFSYTAVAALYIIPHYAQDTSGPLLERYGYLGGSAREIAMNALIRPDRIADHLASWEQLWTVLLLLAGVGFLPLLRPKLLPPLALLVALPLLSTWDDQRTLAQHYGVVPGTFAIVLAAMAVNVLRNRTASAPLVLRSPAADQDERWKYLFERVPVIMPGLAAALAFAVFMAASPLPPSFAAEWSRFEVGHHSRLAESFVDDVPADATVSAQAGYVPHLSQRHNIYEFPRIEDSTIVIIDSKRRVPFYDWPGYEACRSTLASLGFSVVRSEDGIEMYERSVADAAWYNGGSECG